MGIIRCCYKCTERHESCHSNCEKYAAEKATLKKYNSSDGLVYDYYRAKWRKTFHYKQMKTRSKKR